MAQMEIEDVWLNHKFIDNSDIVDANLALVDSPQLNIRTVFQGLRLISRIKPEYCPIGMHCVGLCWGGVLGIIYM